MICRNCGKKIPDDASFCPACGRRIESHLREEDRVEYKYKDPNEYVKKSRKKRKVRSLISLIAAIIFVVAAFIIVFSIIKPDIPKRQEPKAEEQATEEQAEEKNEFPKTMYVASEDGLILRKEPGQQNDMILALNNGQEIQVEKIEDGWAYTTVNGHSGWCSAEYLTENKDEIKPDETKPNEPDQNETGSESEVDRSHLVEPSSRIESGYHGTVKSDGGLNLRCGPGQEYDILMVVPDGTEVVEEGEENGWIFIKYDGQYGWVNSVYITPKE